MKQTAVEWLVEQLSNYDLKMVELFKNEIKQAKEMEKEQKGHSEEEVGVLVDMLQKCKEYFLLKTDSKSDERADAIGEVLKQFKKK